MPKVSVIMGIYNCAPYLQEALDSLYAQTFQDFEIILCEDGSKDNTYEVARHNADSHPNIILLRNDRNLGLNTTLNNCLTVAKGQYIARMDGDDISFPTRFEKEVKFLDEHPEYSIVSCPMVYFDQNGDFKTGTAIQKPQNTDFLLGSPFCHAPCMIRTEAYRAVDGYTVDKRLLRVEDDHLWFKLYAAGHKGYNLQEALYKMRDDRNALARRTWWSRKNEMYVRHIGFKMLHLPWYCQIYALRPLFVYLAPRWVYRIYHNKKR